MSMIVKNKNSKIYTLSKSKHNILDIDLENVRYQYVPSFLHILSEDEAVSASYYYRYHDFIDQNMVDSYWLLNNQYLLSSDNLNGLNLRENMSISKSLLIQYNKNKSITSIDFNNIIKSELLIELSLRVQWEESKLLETLKSFRSEKNEPSKDMIKKWEIDYSNFEDISRSQWYFNQITMIKETVKLISSLPGSKINYDIVINILNQTNKLIPVKNTEIYGGNDRYDYLFKIKLDKIKVINGLKVIIEDGKIITTSKISTEHIYKSIEYNTSVLHYSELLDIPILLEEENNLIDFTELCNTPINKLESDISTILKQENKINENNIFSLINFTSSLNLNTTSTILFEEQKCITSEYNKYFNLDKNINKEEEKVKYIYNGINNHNHVKITNRVRLIRSSDELNRTNNLSENINDIDNLNIINSNGIININKSNKLNRFAKNITNKSENAQNNVLNGVSEINNLNIISNIGIMNINKSKKLNRFTENIRRVNVIINNKEKINKPSEYIIKNKQNSSRYHQQSNTNYEELKIKDIELNYEKINNLKVTSKIVEKVNNIKVVNETIDKIKLVNNTVGNLSKEPTKNETKSKEFYSGRSIKRKLFQEKYLNDVTDFENSLLKKIEELKLEEDDLMSYNIIDRNLLVAYLKDFDIICVKSDNKYYIKKICEEVIKTVYNVCKKKNIFVKDYINEMDNKIIMEDIKNKTQNHQYIFKNGKLNCLFYKSYMCNNLE